MSRPADLPSRTSHSHDLSDLEQRVQSATSSTCGTSSLLQKFYTRGQVIFRRVPHRLLRHGFIALSIPAALIAGSVIPAAQRAEQTLAPVAAAYAVQGSLSAFVGDAAVADEAISDDFVFTDTSLALGAPVNMQFVPVVVDVANLRNGPGTNYTRIGRLKQGQTVQLLGRNADWFQIKTSGGQVGWLHAELVEVASGVARGLVTVKAGTAPAAAARFGSTTEAAVNLRGGPGTNHGSLAKLPKGATLEILGQQDGWYQVSTQKGTVGWVTASFFKPGAAAPTAAAGPITAAIAANKVNLRQGPSTSFASLGKMAAGYNVQVIARNGGWFKIKTPKGSVGWVSQDLVSNSAAVAQRVPVTNDVPAAPKAQAVPKAAAAPTVAASNDAAGIALRFVGARYVYGGSSPAGFDCSGLTKYVYSQLGISLPHKASLQFSERFGQRVGFNQLAPGDLVFFARTTGAPGITHVALYVGNGMMVSANTPRTGVQYVSIYGQYWSSRFAGGLRVYR
jgi:cell wall-associated NlpC family hydrolase